MLPEDMFILLIATDLRNKIATATDTDELTVTTHELNIMHSGHVRPPSIILLYLSSFHPMKTPVLCMVLIYFLWYITLCPTLHPDTIYEIPSTLPYSYINCTTRQSDSKFDLETVQPVNCHNLSHLSQQVLSTSVLISSQTLGIMHNDSEALIQLPLITDLHHCEVYTITLFTWTRML